MTIFEDDTHDRTVNAGAPVVATLLLIIRYATGFFA